MSNLSQNIGLILPEKKERYSLDIINQNNKIIDDEIEKINKKFVEVENKFTALESDCDWKETVDTFENIETKYPNPEDGWTVNVKDTNYTWRYNGEKWIPISANAIPIVTNDVSGILNKDDYAKFKQTSLGMQIDGETVYLDKKNGKIGYNTDPERGADTFVPFRCGDSGNESNNNSTFENPFIITLASGSSGSSDENNYSRATLKFKTETHITINKPQRIVLKSGSFIGVRTATSTSYSIIIYGKDNNGIDTIIKTYSRNGGTALQDYKTLYDNDEEIIIPDNIVSISKFEVVKNTITGNDVSNIFNPFYKMTFEIYY